MSGPTKWPPVPLWDRETCGGVWMATALIVVPGSEVECGSATQGPGVEVHTEKFMRSKVHERTFQTSLWTKSNVLCTSVHFLRICILFFKKCVYFGALLGFWCTVVPGNLERGISWQPIIGSGWTKEHIL
jgi:hypothetical protein